jgi:hypothetical protein
VVVHRRQLPILDPCDAFAPTPGSADAGGSCERCQTQVHDVSAMRESELRRFLAARVGTRVCLTYRTDAAGWLSLRPEPLVPSAAASVTLGALALLLAACAGHAAELETPGAGCRDADGYEVSCPGGSTPSMLSVPEAMRPTTDRDPAADGCPVPPAAPRPRLDPLLELDPPPEVEPVAELLEDPRLEPVSHAPAEPADDASPTARPTSAKYRANFSIDPDVDGSRVILVGYVDVDERWGEPLRFAPTKQLWRDWKERRAERKAERERWRMHPRVPS